MFSLIYYRNKSLKIIIRKLQLLFMMTLLEKLTTYDNNSETLSTVKINEHTSSGYSLFTQCSFDKQKISLIVIEVNTVLKGF